MEIKIRQPLTFSEIGRKDNQEDNVYPSAKEVTTANRFFILCDGMGGHDNGEVASDTVCHALGHYFEEHIPADGIVTTDYFKEALEYAYDKLDEQDNGAVKKMGTTMTCLYLHKKGYLVAHIGDSRIYHVRPENTDPTKGRLGVIYQSSDHSLVNDLLKAGELTEEEAINFPQKNIITRAMQPNLERRYKADVFSFSDVKSGDYFFLCSDGVLEQLTNERLCEILASPISDEEKLEAIRQVCYGKTKDNFTCYLIPIDHVTSEEDDDSHDEELIVAGVELEEEMTDNNYRSVTTEELSPNVQSVSLSTPTPSKKKFYPLLKWLFVIILVMVSLTYAASTWWKNLNENRGGESPQLGTFIKVPQHTQSCEAQDKVEELLVPEDLESLESTMDIEQENEQSPTTEVSESVENGESTILKEETIHSIEKKTPNTVESCIYDKIQSSKEENTASSDSSVAVDLDAHMKQNM